ncbi:MAG: FeoA family protein [Betaproteobacteria bacterium]
MTDSTPPLRPLADLPAGTHAVVQRLRSGEGPTQASLVRRLGELGFIPGEPVQMLRRGPGGREPLAVQIGDTQFALRFFEAQCIEVAPV